jgi:hypothetical protein
MIKNFTNKLWAYYGKLGDIDNATELICTLHLSEEDAYEVAFLDMLTETILNEEISDVLDVEEEFIEEEFNKFDYTDKITIFYDVIDKVNSCPDRIYDITIEEVEAP